MDKLRSVCGVYLHYFTSKSGTKTIETRKKSKKPSKYACKSLFFFRQLQHNLKEHRNPSGAYDHQLTKIKTNDYQNGCSWWLKSSNLPYRRPSVVSTSLQMQIGVSAYIYHQLLLHYLCVCRSKLYMFTISSRRKDIFDISYFIVCQKLQLPGCTISIQILARFIFC